MSLNSPGVFFGMTPNGDTLNGDKGGISNGPDRRPAKNSFSILISITSGLCKADIKFWEWLEIRWPSWWIEKPKVKPETRCSAMKGVYPDKKKLSRSTLTGVGSSFWLWTGDWGFGSLGRGFWGFTKGTKKTRFRWMRPFAFLTRMFVLKTGAFSTLTEFKTVT